MKRDFKFKPGDLISRSLKNSPILFILGCEDETENFYAKYRYYNIAYPDNINKMDKTMVESYYFKVNR